METPGAMPAHLRKVRSFVRRPGRATAAQRRAFAELLPRFDVDAPQGPLDLPRLFGRDARRVLDIGFGDGEALVTNALNNPTVDYLGVEVHEPGIGHLLLLLEQTALTNVRVIARDAADVAAGVIADRELRRRRSVLPGSVAQEAASQAAPRSAAIRRRAGARAEARRLLARRDGLGATTRATRARCSRRAPTSSPWPRKICARIRSHSGHRRSSSVAAGGSDTTSSISFIGNHER